jgi:hypothetical protein
MSDLNALTFGASHCKPRTPPGILFCLQSFRASPFLSTPFACDRRFTDHDIVTLFFEDDDKLMNRKR